jgi:hypothetical protein
MAAQCRMTRGFDDNFGLQLEQLLNFAQDPWTTSATLASGIGNQRANDLDMVFGLEKLEYTAADGTQSNQPDTHGGNQRTLSRAWIWIS